MRMQDTPPEPSEPSKKAEFIDAGFWAAGLAVAIPAGVLLSPPVGIIIFVVALIGLMYQPELRLPGSDNPGRKHSSQDDDRDEW
jgi:uncharacterized RDD family membrane protein YckC